MFPVRLAAKIIAALAVVVGIAAFIMYPLALNLVKRVTVAEDYYSASNKSALGIMAMQKKSLLLLEKKLTDITAAPGKSASSYDFLQDFLKKRNIQAVKIVGGAEEKEKGMIQHDYSIEYEGTWHSAGSLYK